VLAAGLGLVLAGCATHEAHMPASPDDAGIVRGTAAYLERVALPADAELEVWITDVSPLILALPLIAQTTVRSEGRQVPLPFELRYEPSKILPDHTYGTKAVIKSGGRILFATETDYHVITQGNPTQVDLRLASAGAR
jgi:putative lipoprotein